jgi:predicted transcriptional regulator
MSDWHQHFDDMRKILIVLLGLDDMKNFSLHFVQNLAGTNSISTCYSCRCPVHIRLYQQTLAHTEVSLMGVEKAASSVGALLARAGIIRDGSLKLFSKSIRLWAL